ncbi:MAG TPA: hypothetical protein VNS08_13820 [Ureibacillus sp.]|nr:hypothetical protein [Ureibacillus sp.]
MAAIMTNLKLLILSLTFLATANAQTSNSLSQADIDFINGAVKDKRYAIKLVSEMIEYNLTEIKNYLERPFFIKRMVDENDKDISDTIKLTKYDKAQMLKKLDSLKDFKWTQAVASKLNLDNISLISYDTSRSHNMAYAIKYHIVPPIYFDKGNYCILSFSYSCGGLCGHGQITVYKRTEAGWKRWNNLSWYDE